MLNIGKEITQKGRVRFRISHPLLLESHTAYVAVSHIVCFIIVQEWPLFELGVLKGSLNSILQAI